MRDIVVEVRHPDGTRKGQIAQEYLDLTFSPVFNNIGNWEISLPAEHSLVPVLKLPASGVVITFEGRVFSGPMRTAELLQNAEDPIGTWKFTGVSDEIILAARSILPDPTLEPDSQTTVSHDVRSGPGETVFKDLVYLNAGAGALLRRQAVNVAPDLGRGETVYSSARFVNLLEHLAKRAVTAKLGFQVTQVGDNREFDVYVPTDRSRFIQMDILNDGLEESGWGFSAPSATEVWVAGAGEGTDRIVRKVTTTASEDEAAVWGVRFEVFEDQRQTDVLAELDQAGNEVLTETGTTVRSIKVVPAESGSMRVGHDWWLGDLVTVTVEGTPAVAQVTQIGVRVNSEGVTVTAVVGDPTGFTFESRLIAKTNELSSRVSALERNAEPTPLPDPPPPGFLAFPAGFGGIWFTNTAPAGTLLCQGQAVSRTTYAALWNLLGVTYGAGDGSTTFNLPDFRGRMPVGRDSGQTEFDALNEAGGAKAHTLTIAEMPSHTHSYRGDITAYPGGITSSIHFGSNSPSHPSYASGINAEGGGAAHNNLPPYRVINYIITTGGV